MQEDRVKVILDCCQIRHFFLQSVHIQSSQIRPFQTICLISPQLCLFNIGERKMKRKVQHGSFKRCFRCRRHPRCCCISNTNFEACKEMLWSSDSQPRCRDTLGCQGCRQLIQFLDLHTYMTIQGCRRISTEFSKGAANQKKLGNTALEHE